MTVIDPECVAPSLVMHVIVRADGHFDVHLGERVAPGLIWDEMLAEVARLTSHGPGKYMQHIDLHLARMQRNADRAVGRPLTPWSTPL